MGAKLHVIRRQCRGARIVVFVGVLFALVAGCGSDDSEDLDNMADCGNFVFPDDVKLVWYHQKLMFGDELTNAVVDIPVGEIEEFKQRSGLEKFEPGVPRRWRESWEDSGQAQLLANDTGNEHLVELNRSPTRWVVIHDTDSTPRRVFLTAGC